MTLPAQLGGTFFHQFFQMVAVLVQLLVQLFFLGNVLLHGNKMADAAIVFTDGVNDGEFHKFRAVLAFVDKLALPGLAEAHGLPERLVCFLMRFCRLQDARVLTHEFFAAVTGVAQDGCVHVFDLGIQVGDDYACRTLLHRLGQFA